MTKCKPGMTIYEIDRLRAKLVAVGWGTIHSMVFWKPHFRFWIFKCSEKNLLAQARRWREKAGEIDEILAETARTLNKSKVRESSKQSIDVRDIYQRRKKETVIDRHCL